MNHRVINVREIASELSSIRDLVRWGVSAFNGAGLAFAQGMPDALDEAVYLCLSALQLPPDFSADYFDCKLTFVERKAVLEYYQLRIEEKLPAAYITQQAWFAGLEFYVDKRVLIPRSPFAELIEQHFQPWIEPDRVSSILELCTGSGCIAIACAYAFEEAAIVATDISEDALAVASINRERHGLEARLQLLQSDLYADVPQQSYDIIVSNPPYVSQAEMAALPAEFDHEPSLALAAGLQGLDMVIPILRGARERLNDHGILVVEVGYSQPMLEQCLPMVPFTWLDFEYGGEGVFMLTAEQLAAHQDDFEAATVVTSHD